MTVTTLSPSEFTKTITNEIVEDNLIDWHEEYQDENGVNEVYIYSVIIKLNDKYYFIRSFESCVNDVIEADTLFELLTEIQKWFSISDDSWQREAFLPKIHESGAFIPNGQSAKSGLNLSWSDAAFAQFFQLLGHIAGKAGAIVIAKNPAYTSQLLSYRDDVIFTDCSIREYWDADLKLLVDRDINAAINIKRVGLDIFPTIKRRKGKVVIVGSITDDTSKEVLRILRSA